MMSRRSTQSVAGVLVLGMLAGCFESKNSLHYFGDAELQYYKDVTTQVDYPNVCPASPDEVTHTDQPRTLLDRRKGEIRDMTLAEVLQTAMMNSRIIRCPRNTRGRNAEH